MKKIYIILIAIICNQTLSNAQSNTFRGFHIGAAAGVNGLFILNQNAYGDRELEYASKIGGSARFCAGYEFRNHSGFQIELGWSQGGQNYKDFVNLVKVTREVNLTYYQIPVMYKYAAGGKENRFFIMAGPQFGFLQSSSIYYNDKQVLPIDVDVKAKGFFVSNDIGLKVAFGDDFKLNDDFYISTGIQLYYGISDINDPLFRNNYRNKPYEKSVNAYCGFELGLHYFIH